MPPQSGKSSLFGKLGNNLLQAHTAHKADETDWGDMGLPAGIENGIAVLTECKFDTVKPGKQNAGEFYFYAAGVVISPKEHEGVPIEGSRTQITEMLCNTPNSQSRKTVGEHLAWIYNEMRKLGVDTSQIDLEKNPNALEEVAAALKEAKPTFRFRTWKGQKQTTGPYAGREPRVNHTWGGLVDAPSETSESGVVDQTPQAPATPAPAAPAAPRPSAPAPSPAPAPTPLPAPSSPEMDLDGMAAVAADNPEIAKKLTDLAKGAGITEQRVNDAESWEAVVAMIREADQGSGGPGQDQEWEPQVEEIYAYRLLGADGKPAKDKNKREKPPVEVEVKAVDKGKKTVDLLNNVDKKTVYKGVPWDQLLSAE